ncbi:MAG: YetF domain-containing protein [Martelella sp.]|uniref:DUF421 domain-containing protein n=1 Tax=Martelella sp. TaxID=1969699 RepID=UPI0032421497
METVARGFAVYIVLLAILRFSGRRAVAQMTTFDLVLLLIVAETTQQALLGDDFSVTNAIVLIVVLFTVDVGLSYVKQWAPGLALFLDGTPTVLISDGTPDLRAFKRARVSLEDVLATARQLHGLERLDQIKSAVLEADGALSIIPR